MPSKPVRTSRNGITVLGDRRRPSKGERQGRSTLEALIRLLETRPIGELAVGEIAAEAGVQRSGYYFQFDSKYAALAVITSEIWSELMDRVQTFVRPEAEDAADFLRRSQRAAIDMWRAHDAVLVASVQAIPLDTQIAEMWSGWNARLANIRTDEVLKDQRDSLTPPSTDDLPALVATLVEMTMHVFYQDLIVSEQSGSLRRQGSVRRS
ncbi:TetR/AcrR family transcriptional regulator [Rhodococcus opacus]|uniref:TetR/AcrR family transcriptional regulator n=1 Tax=Rhodococcus opacus TaxID=37919 RepID=A0AAX3YSC2_RHOOP|nr:TetR/AcrR family transcriptional regulator [Rhodococcus opacus]MCZ4590202.1 TetR/AcrR family transcriptional regulator [Rhodococcus opacus]WLF52307.1 TetR/AcrR family transcriptional regulator [Rhodococcus opacus]